MLAIVFCIGSIRLGGRPDADGHTSDLADRAPQMNEVNPPKSGRRDVLERHIANRKGLGDYLKVKTKIHRADVARTDEFLGQIRFRIAQAQAAARNHPLG